MSEFPIDASKPLPRYVDVPAAIRRAARAKDGVKIAPRLNSQRETMIGKSARSSAGGAFGRFKFNTRSTR